MEMTNSEWKKFKRITIFIDAANVIYSLRDLGWRIDYKQVMKYFKKHSVLCDIYFYTAFFETDSGRKNMLEMLSRKGFIIRSKEVKSIKTKDGILHKANCDVELTMDVMSLYNSFDAAILMTGDSDFVPLISFLHAQGKQVIVISTRGHVAKEIIDASNMFIYFGQFRKDWEMPLNSKNPDKRGS